MDSLPIEMCERGMIPDPIARAGMRRLIATRLTSREALEPEWRSKQMRRFIERASTGPIAQHTDDANAQHYELPPAFFAHVLGAHRKYSGCLFEAGIDNLRIFGLECDDSLPGDLNGDGLVNGADVGIFLALWGTSNPDADLNGNGTVEGGDLGLLIANWTG